MSLIIKAITRNSLGKIQLVQYSTIKKADPVIAALGKTQKKKTIGKGIGGSTQKVEFDVETDANVLVNYVCGSNIFKENGEEIKLKPDSEYPEWLWTLRTGKAPALEDLDPNTLEYWKRVRKLGRRRVNYLKSVKPF